ncbi:MAG: hypothetical protein JNN27_09630 [Planctomycetes bacterium]|nr:hypothetical protein [Planctomycetota bacterium]
MIRRAAVADVAAIAHFRARVFIEKGTLEEFQRAALVSATVRYLKTALPAGEYMG